MSSKNLKIMGLRIFSDNLETIKLQNRNHLLVTISPNSYGMSTYNPFFLQALEQADYVVLDGVYFALASIFLKGKNIKKNQGPVVFHHFMDRLNAEKGKAFFLGASEETLEKIKIRGKEIHPNVQIETFSPPYKEKFSEKENQIMIKRINEFNPDILFIGMTAPKQEIWAYENKDKIHAKLSICIGGVFNWYAGDQKEIHPLWWKLRLGWLKRTIDRPEILKRYPNIGIFFYHLFLAMLGIKKFQN